MFDFAYWTAPAVVALAALLYRIIYNATKKDKSTSIQNVINNIAISEERSSETSPMVDSEGEDISQIQARTHILFIDDEKFDIVNSLKTAGWVNTILARNIKSLQDKRILAADIIFVDINGVAANLFKDEGLGLARELKNRYPKKRVILYSGETTGNIFDPTLKIVDDTLAKNAEPFEFISMVERFVL